jgi:hypothetical protein
MVYWGAGVHQWQVTLNELFHQLYVRGRYQFFNFLGLWLIHVVGQYRASHLLSAQLLSQNGHPPPIPQVVRTKS